MTPRPNTTVTAANTADVIDRTPSSAADFATLGVPAPMVAALAVAGVTTPFPIQAATLPDALAGRDVLGRARTGSGKTIAFAVPVAQVLRAADYRRTPGRPGALVVVPTRELAAQVAASVTPLAQAVGLRCATVHGGVAQGPQIGALRRGVDILVATPGRLEDLIAQHHCTLDRVRVTVLDEADHLADLGFLPAVRRLLNQTPATGQRLLFSATLDDAVAALSNRYLRDPVTHSVDSAEASPELLEHHLFTVQPGDKAAVVIELAAGCGRSLLFTRTKHGARKLVRGLTAAGIPATELHSNLAQGARQRNLAAFSDGTVRVMVATDIAARGIHVDDVALVVHVDPPDEHKAYLHRSGRTARAGAAGTVVTVATTEQSRDVSTLFRKAKIRPLASVVTPGDGQAAALTGPPAARRPTPSTPDVQPTSAAVVQPTGAQGQRRRQPTPAAGQRRRQPTPATAGRPPGATGQRRRQPDHGVHGAHGAAHTSARRSA